MAELTPLYMDIANVYSGDELGLPYRDIISEGIVAAGDLAVTQHAGAAGLSVDIAKGAAWILGDTNADAQPCYRVRNDAVVNLGIAPDPSNPRIVLIVGQITDATFAGAARQWQLQAIHGTPAGTPVAPALPASAILLAQITVAAAATSIVNANITNKRTRAVVGGGQALSGCSFSVYPASTQPLGAGAWTLLTFDTAEWDTLSVVDLITHKGRATLPVGQWRLSASVSIQAGTVTDQERTYLAIYKNGSAYRYINLGHTSGTDNSLTFGGTCLVDSNGTDYFEVYAFIGTADSLASGSVYTRFDGERV